MLIFHIKDTVCTTQVTFKHERVREFNIVVLEFHPSFHEKVLIIIFPNLYGDTRFFSLFTHAQMVMFAKVTSLGCLF